jgi:hypothetical protein
MSGNVSGTIRSIANELGVVFEPLIDAVGAGPGGIHNFLEMAGVYRSLGEEEGDRVAERIEDRFVDPLDTIDEKVLQGELSSPSDVEAVVDAVRDLSKGFKAIDELDVSDQEAAAIGDQIVDFLLIEYLYNERPTVHHALGILGLIRGSPPNRPGEIRIEKFAEAIDDPAKLAKTAFQWPDNFQGYLLQWYVMEILKQQGVPASLVDTPADEVENLMGLPDDSIGEGKAVEPDDLRESLNVPIVSGQLGSMGAASLGVTSYPLPETSGNGGHYSGLALAAYGIAKGSVTEDLGNGWQFRGKFGAEAGWGVALQPKKSDGTPDVNLRPVHGDVSGITASAEGEIGFNPAKLKGTDKEVAPIVGTTEGSYFGIKYVGARAGVSFEGDEFEASIALPALAELVIDPQGGFVEKLIPKAITSEFEVVPGYSTKKGFYFDGSATLKIPLKINQQLGPVTLKEVYIELAIDLETGDVTPTVAISADGSIGPIGTSIKRLGIEGLLKFPERRDGNFGIADLTNEFKPPSGAGLSLDTGPISGGGYIEYDAENERYAGVFDVTIGPVDVKIMGLLTTEMPDGSDGFSLLLSVFGKFPPVQLGFGFTLNGLGGVIGVNRALKAKPLRKATRSGNLDSVLFPEDPVAHAQRIVSDLRSIYPPTRGQHVFGPMARFGWGAPTILTMDLGIVLQLPAAKVAILGKMGVGLPTVEAPKQAQIVRLNLAVTGVLEPERQLFSLDAALYDSRVMLFAVKGEMAMRIGWGDNPKFVLSVGGFNPRFKPPSNFPKVKRVTVCLDIPGGTPSVTWKGYFAVTANTVQVGASFDAKFEAGPVSAHAWWGLDALFQFNPFKFVVDFEAGVSVSVFGFELSISLNGTIKGPSPVHVTGQLKITLPGPLPDPSPRVNITIGESKDKEEQLPVADVLPKFGDELAKTENWSAQTPADGEGVVSLREIEPGDDQVLAHPTARLSVRQTLVPIDRRIERFGNNRPKHVEFDFEVDAGTADLPPVDGAKKEEFAPEQYLKMSDSEKMNAPTFRRWMAGREVSGDLFTWGCTYHDGDSLVARRDNATEAVMSYELKQLDSEVERRADEAFERVDHYAVTDGGDGGDAASGYPVDAARALADDGAVANADSRWRGSAKFEPSTEADGEDVEIESNYELDATDATAWTLDDDGGEKP